MRNYHTHEQTDSQPASRTQTDRLGCSFVRFHLKLPLSEILYRQHNFGFTRVPFFIAVHFADDDDDDFLSLPGRFQFHGIQRFYSYATHFAHTQFIIMYWNIILVHMMRGIFTRSSSSAQLSLVGITHFYLSLASAYKHTRPSFKLFIFVCVAGVFFSRSLIFRACKPHTSSGWSASANKSDFFFFRRCASFWTKWM